MTDIVITARYQRAPSGRLTLEGGYTVSTREQVESQQNAEPYTGEEDTNTVHLYVTVEDVTPENEARVKQAAAVLLENYVDLNNRLSSNINASWSVLGMSATAFSSLSDVRQILVNTTGNGSFNDGGVGYARRGDPNTYYYAAIVGDPNLSSNNSGTNYATSYYNRSDIAQGKGVLAIMMHDMLGHMSDNGNTFFNISVAYWRQEVGPTVSADLFYRSAYADNVEKYANDVMYAAARALGISEISGASVNSKGTRSVDPSEIYQSRNPG